jgi:hypothetical protein
VIRRACATCANWTRGGSDYVRTPPDNGVCNIVDVTEIFEFNRRGAVVPKGAATIATEDGHGCNVLVTHEAFQCALHVVRS